MSNVVLSEETFTYDAAGNITDAPDSCFQYDTNNRLVIFDGNDVSYDLDGNMLYNGINSFSYDSANRLVSAGGHTYTYNAEDVRIRNLCASEDTTYTYDVNCKLSRLLCKTTNGVTTKYVYGRGLIGEEVNNNFKTYHFDFRGSTIAITDANGNITDTFAYDTYGKLISRTGTSDIIFGYNGEDGVVTDKNGLIYMRARYYSHEMCRFVNADIVHGEISDSTSLNRYSYVNGNPVSYVDPFGLSHEMKNNTDHEVLPNFYDAVLITRFDDQGLPVVGHTQLYLLGDNGVWYMTEFSGRNKSSAKIKWFKNCVPDGYDSTTGTFKNVKGVNYVKLHGNFNESAQIAYDYSKNDQFGGYNFFFNNCANYTDTILAVADVDGLFSQTFVNSAPPLIAIPVLREWEMSIYNSVDSIIENVANLSIEAGKFFKGKSAPLESALIANGNLIKDVSNLGGDLIGGLGEIILDGIEKGLDWITFWD